MLNKILSKLIIKNVKTHKPSYIVTAFIVGFLIINIKLLFSGIQIFGTKMSDVSITDWATGLAALSAMYISNKHVGNIQINKINEQKNKQE